jgi:transposase
LSEKKKYRTWTVRQKLEIVLAGMRGEVSVAEVCREHRISETLSVRSRGLMSGR